MSEKLFVLVLLYGCIMSYWTYKCPNNMMVIGDE